MSVLVVGGTFDSYGGKPSSVIEKIKTGLDDFYLSGTPTRLINGGTLDTLKHIDFKGISVLVWMPNVDNTEDKILPTIKEQNPRLLLVSSKRVIEKDYTDADIIGRLLKTKSNLGIRIRKTESGRFEFRVLDPLGNEWGTTDQIALLCDILKFRIQDLLRMKRLGSAGIGERREFTIPGSFVSLVKDYGKQFSKFVNAVNPNRLLGNAATRCSYGFPSTRQNERIFVTRRNVDKETLTADDFVEVGLYEDKKVIYYGDVKPSVDSAIQLLLFNYYRNINYIIHGHVYASGSRYFPVELRTRTKFPCGAVNEFDEIVELFPNPEAKAFIVNLWGHGCLLLSSDIPTLRNVELVGRPFPEADLFPETGIS